MKCFLFIFAFLIPSFAYADGGASLSLLPAASTSPIGDVFTVSVNVDTAGKSVNAVEGTISFNTDELEVAGFSKDGSILGSWTAEPTVFEKEGMISFGGSIAGGFAGNVGKIFSIDFRGLKNAESQVRFGSGAAILATDGNILTVMNSGMYTLVPKEVFPSSVEPVPQVLGVSTSTEEKIVITSSTHPDENKWYTENAAKFAWTLPPDASAVHLLVNASSSSLPTKLYSPPVSEKTVKDVEEGISYFHLQAKTEFGWGESVHYRFQTDTEKPEAFHIMEASTTDSFGFLFDARDKTSGIEKYLVSIDGGAEMEWKDDGRHMYTPEAMESGSHALLAKAVDFAGNFATSSIAFTINPANPPTITDFQEKILPGNPLVIRGKAEPNAIVSIWVRKDGARAAETIITAGQDGAFTFILNWKAEEGIYEIYAEKHGRGTRSAPSASVLITVSQPKIILFGNVALGYLSVLIPLAALVLLLLFVLVYGFHRFKIFRETLRKEVEEVETASRQSFSALRKEICEDERILESIGSFEEKTKKQKAAAVRLQKNIDAAESNVEKEISDVKEKVKKIVKMKIKKVD